jgi:signal transduction histidine kinase
VREREKLSTVLNSIGDLVIVLDTDKSILLISQSAISAMRLYTDVDYTGRGFSDIITFGPLEGLFESAIANEAGDEGELELPNGRNYFARIVPMAEIGYAIIMQDITTLRETDRLKSELVATVSHDLKQPLSVMRGYVDLLQMHNEFDTQSMHFVTKLEASIRNMRQLIDDLLDFARIESGEEISFERVPIRQVLIDCVEGNRDSAIAKAMTFDHTLPDNLAYVRGDYIRLQQVFNNLIGNAIKYTPPEGEVKITAERNGATVRVSIRDNGLGISPEDKAHIFERFFRVRRPETDSIEGTGLGLAIVKRLIDAHEGKIRVDSKLGEGSEFHVTLPAI